MVFNWFNRKFKKGDSEDKKESESKQPQSQKSDSSPTQTQPQEAKVESSPSPQTTQDDYLKWAKAAYQQIQQRQTEEKAEEPSPVAEEQKSEPPEEPKPKEVETVVESDREEVTEEKPSPVAEEIGTGGESDREEVIAEEELSPVAEEVETVVESDREEVTEEVIAKEELSPVAEEVETVVESDREEVTEEVIAEEELSPVAEEVETVVESDREEGIVKEELSPVTEEVIAEEEPSPVAEEAIAAEEPDRDTETLVETEPEPLTKPVAAAIATPEPEAEPAAKSTPAWMKKSDALERLKETAIETPEPEVRRKPAVDFDEDFVWSAKVLAEQGRRPEEVSLEEISWLKRLREGLGKTRRSLINQLKAIVGQGPLNEDAVMEIEALLLQADVGVEATEYIIDTLQEKLREEALPPEEAIAYLKTILCDLLEKPLPDPENAALVPQEEGLNIWLMTGVNGAGKTTTIGKLANMARESGYSCIIAAADTFRAAAVEQVTIWGERSQTQVIANPGKNTDPAAVVYDAINAALSRDVRLLLVDTAGRLQNKKNLMAELSKIRRIIDKKAPNATVESLLVLDATLGQNGLRQAQVFSESAKLSGVILTKLDSSAKGGVALAVAKQLNLPIRFVGAGEGIQDLRPFSSYEFIEALLSE
ncbi:MAG: signal recognition particle-docking protein FtsY [Spirulina sp.]